MKRIRMVLLILALYGLTAGVFWISSVKTIEIHPYIDSYSWESVPDANNGGSDNFEITSSVSGPKNMRGWLAFNTSKIPDDEWIISAKLRLRVWKKTTDDPSSGIGDSTGRTYGVYRLTQRWAEYNVTWTNQPSYTEQHSSTASVPPGNSGWDGPELWMEWNVIDILRDWLSGEPNYGVMVKDSVENSPILYSTQFFTHDKPLPIPYEEHYPRLIVTYLSPLAVGALVAAMSMEGVFIIGLTRIRHSNSDVLSVK